MSQGYYIVGDKAACPRDGLYSQFPTSVILHAIAAGRQCCYELLCELSIGNCSCRGYFTPINGRITLELGRGGLF